MCHARAAGASLGVGVAVRIGIDVVGVCGAGCIADELNAGNADVVGREEGLITVLQGGVDPVDDREFRARLPNPGVGRVSSEVELTAVCTTRADSAEAARRAWGAR
jgi:hypothetical protein